MAPTVEWNTSGTPSLIEDPALSSEDTTKPLGIRGLFWLLFQPTRFFSNARILTVRPYLSLVIYLYLLARSIDRVERQLSMSEVGGSTSRMQSFESMGMLDSWGIYWPVVLFLGPIGAIFVWWIAMWWYELRIGWSGAKERNTKHVRAVFGYSSLILSLPIILLTVYETFAFANYRQAYDADGPWWVLLVFVFLFWSALVSYKGVRAVFSVTVWKARFWLLILPWSIYFIVIAALIALIALGAVDGTSGYDASLWGPSVFGWV